MINPMSALVSLQAVVNAGTLEFQTCALSSEISLHVDQPTTTGVRFTYANITQGTVQAIVIATKVDSLQGLPCFQLGIAVREELRRSGIGTRTLNQAIAEMKHGFARTPIKTFALEVIVARENAPSNALARKVISNEYLPCTDAFSNEASYQYVRRVSVEPLRLGQPG